MSRLKRTCVAKAIAVVAVATIAMNSFAQQEETITGVKDLAGKDLTYINSHLKPDGNYPEDMDKKFFLYNEATGKFLNIGSYWGTHVALADYGKPLWVVSGTREICTNPDAYYLDREIQTNNVLLFTHNMATTLSENQGPYVGWSQVNTNKPAEDRGVFSDRKNTATDIYGWELEFTGDNMNTCKLKTKKTITEIRDQVYADRSCEAYTTTQITEKGLTGYDEWRFFTYDQIYELQKNNADKMNKSLELSFKLKAPGFERGNNEITNWKTYSFKDDASSLWRFGLEHLYNEEIKVVKNDEYDVNSFSTAGFTYTFGTDTYTDKQDFLRNLAKYMCVSATQVAGMIYQDVEVTLPGTYVIECKGYSTTQKAVLFAGVVNPKSSDNTMYNKHLYKTELNQVSGMTAEEKTALHIDDKNMDYAGKAFLGSNQYINQVAVVVPQDVFTDNPGKTIKIRLGVMIGDYEKPVAPTADEWTVFDDFRLQYASKTTDSDLILDQDRNELGYLVNSSDLFQNKTLHLNKKFVLNKWNTFVLPVNLTRDQVWSAFGGTTRLAKLDNLTKSAIEFKSVDLTKLTDEEPAIVAYQPYIIFPVKDPDVTPKYTGNVTINNKLEKVTIAANHYVIPKVTIPTKKDGDKEVSDWSYMSNDHWTTSKISNDGQMMALGTFARTFGEATQDADGKWNITNKGHILDGRDDLKGCYFFDNGKMYLSKDRPRGLRGFSCWFKPTTNNDPSSNALLTIDGVSQGTTGIEDILADYEQPVSRFANGIYNLNGQLVKQGNSTAGLPSGMYIVNGKKCIVR